ncbi:hypothetical protein ABZS79_32120 [Streptomyces griseoloalbus]|uniref:hypothetical protein n=1 Tax=Streptomyces griseoloalbus TaxID=67303 RepID=UPI0033ADEAFB
MARSFRKFYLNQQGRVAKNFNIGGFDIKNSSAVLVTAAEWNPVGAFGPTIDTRLKVNGPDVWVSNIVPHGGPTEAGGVEFMLHVDSNQPIAVAVTITVFEPCEAIQGP